MANYTSGGLYLPDRSDNLPIDTTLKANFELIQNMFDGSRFTADSFNMNGNGSTDSTTAFQNALNNIPENGTLELKRNAEYKISAPLIRDKNIKIIGNGAKITGVHNGQAIKIEGTLKSSKTAQGYTEGQEYLTLNNTTGIEAGDLLRIRHMTDLFDSSRSYYYKGGNFLVTYVDGNKVYIHAAIPYNMANGATVEVYNPVVCDVSDLEIGHTGTLGTSPYGSFGLNIAFAKNSRVHNVKVDNYNHCIKMDQTVNCLVTSCDTGRAYWNGTSESYGLSNYAGNGLTIMNCSLVSGRHGLTVTGQETSYNTTLINCQLGCDKGYSGAGLDCHGSNFSLMAINCDIHRFNLHGNCQILGGGLHGNGGETLCRIAPAEVAERANFILRDVQFYGPITIDINAYGQQATTSRRHIGSLVLENCSGNFPKQIKFESRTRGATVNSIIRRVIVKNCIDATLLFDDYIHNVTFDSVSTTLNTNMIVQNSDGKVDTIKLVHCVIPSRYRVLNLTDFWRLYILDCQLTGIGATGRSFLLTSASGRVYVQNTDLSDLDRGIEGGALALFQTSETTAVNFMTPSNISTRRRVSYTNM